MRAVILRHNNQYYLNISLRTGNMIAIKNYIDVTVEDIKKLTRNVPFNNIAIQSSIFYEILAVLADK